jgi:dipeptidyl aminopeptidase/acylaminoacyl peptidase
MRRGTIVIVLLALLGCFQLAAVAEAATTRPIVYGKTQWEWAGPEGDREIRQWGGLYVTRGGQMRQLTDHAVDREPNVSRDGSTIVFVRKGDLYAMSSDGSDQRQLTGGSELDELPQISPDGSLVLFVRRSELQAPGNLYTVPLAGGESWSVAPFPGDDREAGFSPDGKTIVFVRSLTVPGTVGINDELFSVRPDGTGLTRLTRTAQDELHPRYFSRGIVFDRRRTVGGGPAAIYTIRRDGTRARAVLSWRVGASTQAVSPNGRMLVFSSPARGTWVKGLVGPTRRSLRPRRLAGWTAEHLVFSPDGRRVAGAFCNTSSEVAPFYVLSSIDVFTSFSQSEGESWEPEETGPVQTSVGSRIAW